MKVFFVRFQHFTMEISSSLLNIIPSSGVMLLAHKKEQDKLEVLAATDNSSELLGYCHEELFDLKKI